MDTYENERFNGTCPTCGQRFLQERHDKLLEALRVVRNALQVANDKPCGPITDTVWVPGRPETLFDFIDAAIADTTGNAQ